MRPTNLQMSETKSLYLLEYEEPVPCLNDSVSCDMSRDGFFVSIERTYSTTNPPRVNVMMSLSTGRQTVHIRHRNMSPRIAKFTHDGNRVVIIGRGKHSIVVYDRVGDDWTKMTVFPEFGDVCNVAISNDNTKMICVMQCTREIRIWDLKTEKLLRAIERPEVKEDIGEQDDIESIAFASDDKTFITSEVASASHTDPYKTCCQLWCVETGNVLKRVPDMPIFFKIISMANPLEFLVTISDCCPSIFNVETLKLRPFSTTNGKANMDMVDIMTMSRDETMISYSDPNAAKKGNLILCDRMNPMIDLADEDGNNERETGILAISFSEDGKKLYSFDGFHLSTWSTNTYPRWNIKIHRTFPKEVKNCIKTMLWMITEYVDGGKRKRARLEIPRDVLLYIFSFLQRDR